ncbi:hypothetical protein PFISCL1PPCAC_1047, partial [Pristionchus fissidentatus]
FLNGFNVNKLSVRMDGAESELLQLHSVMKEVGPKTIDLCLNSQLPLEHLTGLAGAVEAMQLSYYNLPVVQS